MYGQRFEHSAQERGHGDERGQVLIIVGLALTGLLVVAALVLNFGSWYGTDANLQKAADLSALAGAQYIATSGGITADSGDPCSSAKDASSCAIAVATTDGVTAGVNNVTSVTATVGSGNSSVTVTAKETDPGLFTSSTRTESATATVGPLNGATGYFPATFTCPPPVSLNTCTAANFPTPPATYTFTFSNSPSPGNFDLLASCGGGSDKEIAQCITCAQTYSWPGLTPQPLPNGCTTSAALCVGATANGAPGEKYNSKNIEDAFQSLYGEVVLVPIYTSTNGQGGANATYNVAGFAAFLITKWDKSTSGLTGTFEGYESSATVEGDCTGAGGSFGADVYYLTV